MESKLALYAVVLAAFCGSTLADTCTNPQVTATSFTSKDSTVVTHIAYITEFSLKCDNALPPNYALYAEVDEKPLTAARIGENSYQVSWTEEVEVAKRGVREVRLFDEEGWANLRRARRTESGAEISPLVTIQLNHSGSYSGPWIKSEVLAAALSVLVVYTAVRQKSKLLA